MCGEAVPVKQPSNLLVRFCLGVFFVICLGLCIFGLFK